MKERTRTVLDEGAELLDGGVLLRRHVFLFLLIELLEALEERHDVDALGGPDGTQSLGERLRVIRADRSKSSVKDVRQRFRRGP